MSLRILWYSNSPDVPTGYGVQTMQIARRMAADGHEVHIHGNFGHRSGLRAIGDLIVWPEGMSNYSLDLSSDVARAIEPDVVFTLYDVWVMKDEWNDQRVISWTPVDHDPVTPDVLRWARKHETIAMSHFGARSFRDAGVEPIATIHHGFEDVYRPTPSDTRRNSGIPEDAFVVMVNAANIGNTPPRKAWSQNLEALAVFMHRHEDVHVYLHTDLGRPSGVPIPVMIEALQMPRERLHVAPPFQYRAGLITDQEMAKLYSASDVLLLASKGEGFGVPVVEAMACGVPSIVSDFAAQPELVTGTGWRVPVDRDWDWNQGSFFCTPRVDGIIAALEDARQHRGERREACLREAEKYRAGTLYDRQWRPLLDTLVAPRQRPGNTKSAKRRARSGK